MGESLPAWYRTTTNLNLRTGDNIYSSKITTLPANTEIKVDYFTTNNWAAVTYNNRRGYVSAKYIRYSHPVELSPPDDSTPVKKKSGGPGWIFTLVLCVVGFFIFRMVALYALGVWSQIMYYAYWFVCIPFYISNWLQRFLAKPWRVFYKRNDGRDFHNSELRENLEWAKLPLYVLLTPLRFVNAFYYNMIVHCGFEMFNYIVEVFYPSNPKEGEDDYFRLAVFLPWRILKYPLWHGALTVIESGVWTVVDTFVPALTLFHGTTPQASTTITKSGRDGYAGRLTGVWNVGSGNFAGNGIYFAPARRTALHYANGSLIVCRVTLGKVLDLGLAPGYVYNQCGYANALGATRWGLQNGYDTGEWWRKDAGWWEYCMYDWQNRYNDSWRIRPLYVLNLNDKILQPIPGGMCHWLFRRMVIEDLSRSFG